MKYLISTSETYRVDTAEEAKALIEENRSNRQWGLIRSSTAAKERRQKGEIVDSWYRVTLTKGFCDEKDPDSHVMIEYREE